MSENFKVIETQEELDKIIKSRLAQKDREVAETYKDYLSPEKVEAMKADYGKQLEEADKRVKEAQDKLKTFDDTVSELTKRAETAEVSLLKNKVAIENNVPISSAYRLIGTTEEELKADAIKFLEEQGQSKTKPGNEPPLHIGTQNKQTNTYEAAMLEFTNNMAARMQN